MNERRHDIDWLRVIAMLAVFVFHCARFFDTEGWHLKNPQQSEVLFVSTRGLIWPWVMELFFLLSGVGAWYALRSRRTGAFIWERVKRLLIPLYTVGYLILLPPQFYFEAITNAGYSGTFWQILLRYFSSIGPPRVTEWPGSLLPMPFSGHLWFLKFLFLISIVTLPLLLYLRSEGGSRWITRLAGWSGARGGIFIFAIPLALTFIGLRWRFGPQSWADFIWYAIYFVIGFIMAGDERFSGAVERHGWISLIIWLVGFFGVIGTFVLVLGFDPYPGHERFSLMYVLFYVIWSIVSWSAVVFMLSIAARYLRSNNRMLAYGNEAVLPFYLFHQTVILIAGFYIIPLNIGWFLKFLLVTTVSLPLVIILYELFVRRINAIRFIFGMKIRQ